jgi:hypothetical protein
MIEGFAFTIGDGSSKYFDGILLVLARKPYNIRDHIHMQKPDSLALL